MKCIALFSGGLDSMISMKLMNEQNIDVVALHINMGFGGKGDKSAILKKRAEIVGAKLKIVDIRESYIKDILFSPKHGYGKNLNPCIDCHGRMIQVAKEVMEEEGASFIISGEVVGQRPKSQRVEAMKQVAQIGLDDEADLILRPMSAKAMEPTLPEIKGWVDREKLLGVTGRNRETQLALAKKYNFEDFESPGGGCLLTDVNFTKKIKESREFSKFDVEELDVLKVGRHLRLPDGARLVVGKDQTDNAKISSLDLERYDFAILDGIVGPISLISKDASLEDKQLACKVIMTYTKASIKEEYKVKISDEVFTSYPFPSKDDVKKYFIV